MAIHFQYADRNLQVKGKLSIKGWLKLLFISEQYNVGHIQYIFCSDEYLLGINKQFLQHDYYTDIITFDLSIDSNSIDAEIYISLDRVKDNSISLKLPYEHEVLRVLAHGALHLCGYSDKTKSEKLIMTDKEDQYLRLYLQHK